MGNRLEKQQSVLGELSIRLLSYAQMKEKSIARTGEFAPVLGITESQEKNLLSRLARSGFIIRLRRGVYLIPERIPAGGKYNPGTAYILSKLFEELKGSYQICGPVCFNLYGFDDQLPNVTHIYNNRISGNRTIAEQRYVFIKVSDGRLGAVRSVNSDSGIDVCYSSKIRSLVDAVYDWWRFNSLPRAYTWIRKAATDDSAVEELIDTVVQYGNQSTMRRIGYLLDSMNASGNQLSRLRSSISSPASTIPFVPEAGTKGKVDKKWGIIQNE